MKIVVGILSAGVLLGACASQPESSPDKGDGSGEPAATANEAAPEPATDLLSGQGRIVSIGDGDIVIDHEGIGWNEPMEQRFTVKDATVVEGFQVGEEVRFWVMMTEAGEGYVDMIEKQ